MIIVPFGSIWSHLGVSPRDRAHGGAPLRVGDVVFGTCFMVKMGYADWQEGASVGGLGSLSCPQTLSVIGQRLT